MEVVSIFLVVSFILIFGFVAEFIFKKWGIPDVLFLILLGFALGPFAFNVIQPDSLAGIAPVFVTFALLFLLFDGAFDIDLASLSKGLAAGLGISLFNFFIATVTVTTVMMVFGYPFLLSLLIGVILSDISELFVIPVLQKLKIRQETFTILTFESAITDVLCIVLALTVMNIIALETVTAQTVLGSIFSLFAVAGLIGIIGGIVWIILVTKVFKEHKSYLMTVAFILFLYVITEYVHGNGALAALFFGLMLGNSRQLTSIVNGINSTKKEERESALDGKLGTSVTTPEEQFFYSQISFFLKVFFFVYIGLLLDISNRNAVVLGIVLSVAVLITRNASYLVTRNMDEISQKLVAGIYGKGLGAAAVVIIAKQYGVGQADFLGKVVYAVIFLTILLSSIQIYIVKKKMNIPEKT